MTRAPSLQPQPKTEPGSPPPSSALRAQGLSCSPASPLPPSPPPCCQLPSLCARVSAVGVLEWTRSTVVRELGTRLSIHSHLWLLNPFKVFIPQTFIHHVPLTRNFCLYSVSTLFLFLFFFLSLSLSDSISTSFSVPSPLSLSTFLPFPFSPPSPCSGLFELNWPVSLKTDDIANLTVPTVKNLPAMWETQVQSLGQEDPLEMGMTTHSNILAWRITWTEEPGGLQSMGSQRVGYN